MVAQLLAQLQGLRQPSSGLQGGDEICNRMQELIDRQEYLQQQLNERADEGESAVHAARAMERGLDSEASTGLPETCMLESDGEESELQWQVETEAVSSAPQNRDERQAASVGVSAAAGSLSPLPAELSMDGAEGADTSATLVDHREALRLLMRQ